MRTGDADATAWLEGKGGRSYVLAMVSERRGKPGSKRWQTPVYLWSVETWETVGDADPDETSASRDFSAKTFHEALRRARRFADELERRARRKEARR